MHVIPLPALADNYIWLVHDDQGNAFVVDPGDAQVVEEALIARRLQLQAILLTHHHGDHVGGVSALRRHRSIPVYAPDDDRIDTATARVGDGDWIDLATPAVHLQVIAIPGHTLSHIGYFGAGLLFCGDTLFSLGCGRLFEGTPAQMLASLDRLSSLPGGTLICCGHEYTAANGRFAIQVEPVNRPLQARLQQVLHLRAKRQPTLPVPIADELAANPFLRVDTEAVTDWCLQRGVEGDRVARFAAVRAAKDDFRE